MNRSLPTTSMDQFLRQNYRDLLVLCKNPAGGLPEIRRAKTDRLFCDKQDCAGWQISEQLADRRPERTMGKGYQVGRIESTRDELLGGPGPGFTITDGYDAVVTFIYSDRTDAEAAHTLITQAIAKAASIVAAYL